MKIITTDESRFNSTRIIDNIFVEFDSNGIAEIDENDATGILQHIGIFPYSKTTENESKVTVNTTTPTSDVKTDNGTTDSSEFKTDGENTPPTYESLMQEKKETLTKICDELSIKTEITDKKDDLAKKILAVYNSSEK